MKYIVTNSLNIENILSTESISPASFYVQRRFGYKTFEQIKELTKFPPILLFSEMPSFEITDSEREAYPMVIEFDDEQQIECPKKVGSCKTCDVFAYGKTIRLTPNNCRLLFFTQTAMRLALLKCRDSKLCKMSDYFKFAVAELGTVSLDAIVKKSNIQLSKRLRSGVQMTIIHTTEREALFTAILSARPSLCHRLLPKCLAYKNGYMIFLHR